MHTLYVFVNRDLQSMTNGKAQAHSGHAANRAVHVMKKEMKERVWMQEWEEERGFGTQINLQAPWSEVEDLFEWLDQEEYKYAGLVVDTTYPFTIPIEYFKMLDKRLLTSESRQIAESLMACTTEQTTAAWVFIHDQTFDHIVDKMKSFKLAP